MARSNNHERLKFEESRVTEHVFGEELGSGAGEWHFNRQRGEAGAGQPSPRRKYLGTGALHCGDGGRQRSGRWQITARRAECCRRG